MDSETAEYLVMELLEWLRETYTFRNDHEKFISHEKSCTLMPGFDPLVIH